MRCDECQHWSAGKAPFGLCEAIQDVDDCREPRSHAIRDDVHAYTEPANEYGSGLSTRADFGCVLFYRRF